MAQVEALSAGTATLTIYDANGGHVNCSVTVNAPAVQASMSLNTSSVTMQMGEQRNLQLNLYPASGWSDVNWSHYGDACDCYTSGSTSATLVSHAAGTSRIEVTAVYGGRTYSATCYVTVEQPAAPQLKISQEHMELKIGQMADLYVVSGRVSNWTSSEPDIIDFFVVGDGSMVQIQGKRAGATSFVGYAADGSTVKCRVVVTAAEPEPQPEPETEPVYQPESERQPEPEYQPEPQPEPEYQPEPDPVQNEPEPQPEPEPKS